jgi:hypothetical protein
LEECVDSYIKKTLVTPIKDLNMKPLASQVALLSPRPTLPSLKQLSTTGIYRFITIFDIDGRVHPS